MTAIISEIISYFEENLEASEKVGEIAYVVSAGSRGIEYLDTLREKGIDSFLLTKVSKDMQGEMHLDMIVEENMAEEEDTHVSNSPSSLSVDGNIYVRGTAISTLKRNEIVEILKKRKADNLLLSSLLLSFDPIREEILGAVSEMGEAIRKIFVDAQDPTEILMLEDFKDSMERLVESGAIVYMVGEAINVEGVIKVPEERAAELLK
ncbi:MAG: hypothetical protein ACI4M4_06205 [Candidatus Ornithospirochaeta sp.]